MFTYSAPKILYQSRIFLCKKEQEVAQPILARAIESDKKHFYEDDILKSLPNEPDAIRLLNELIDLLTREGFRLTKCTSSSTKVLAAIPTSARADPPLNLDLDKLPVDRALGLQWKVEEDVFEFKVIDLEKPETKRGILSTVASLYDPLGFAAPVTLIVKSLLRILWQSKADWEDQLSETEFQQWRQWKIALPAISKVKIPSCYKSNTAALNCAPQRVSKTFNFIILPMLARLDTNLRRTYEPLSPTKQLRAHLRLASPAQRLYGRFPYHA